jgi:hypothetical protein
LIDNDGGVGIIEKRGRRKEGRKGGREGGREGGKVLVTFSSLHSSF